MDYPVVIAYALLTVDGEIGDAWIAEYAGEKWLVCEWLRARGSEAKHPALLLPLAKVAYRVERYDVHRLLDPLPKELFAPPVALELQREWGMVRTAVPPDSPAPTQMQ